MKIGVLALQGAFIEHQKMLESLGAEVVQVRLPQQLEGLDGLIIPGGESTTIGKLATEYGLIEPLRDFAHTPLPDCCLRQQLSITDSWSARLNSDTHWCAGSGGFHHVQHHLMYIFRVKGIFRYHLLDLVWSGKQNLIESSHLSSLASLS
jgi:hypothetical protein